MMVREEDDGMRHSGLVPSRAEIEHERELSREYAAGYRAGQKAMRERAAKEVEELNWNLTSVIAIIRTLPIVEPSDAGK